MSDLITGWKKVATAGPSIDGREISAQHLEEMAETYNQAEYTANIYLDHYRFYGNFGQVVALKTGTDSKDRTCLFAKFSPNKRLIELNSQGQYLFFSIEIWEDFAKSGKAYLAGLAATDEPASVGTEAMQFSMKKGIESHLLSESIKLSLDTESEDGTNTDGQDEAGKDAAGKDADFTLFNKFMSWLPGQETTPKKDNPEDTEMTEEQFKQLMEQQQNQFNQLLETVDSKFSQLPASDDKEKSPDSDGALPETGVTSKQFSQLQESFTQLQNSFNSLLDEKGGTNAGDHDGPADENKALVG